MTHVIICKVIQCNVYTFFKGTILNINIKHQNDNSSKQEICTFKNTWIVYLETVSVKVFMCGYTD